MEKRQQALSDLVQAEIIYMNYTQQDHIFNMMCMTKRTLSNYDEGLLKEASELLQKRAAENVELCQNFLEPCEAAAAPQPPGTPEGLSATPGNGQVTLEWKAPASNGGSLITGYRVYRGIISGVATLVAPLGRDLTYNDGGLENGKRYYYKTSAVNSVGEGPQSKEVTAVPGTPPAPTIRYVKPEDGKATLVWKAPTSDGGSKIIGYNVYRGETRDTVELVKAYETPETSHTDSDLTNGQTYYYKVSAVNSSGEGPQSETISTVPHPASAGGAQA
jgi:predicted phage tail protein